MLTNSIARQCSTLGKDLEGQGSHFLIQSIYCHAFVSVSTFTCTEKLSYGLGSVRTFNHATVMGGKLCYYLRYVMIGGVMHSFTLLVLAHYRLTYYVTYRTVY